MNASQCIPEHCDWFLSQNGDARVLRDKQRWLLTTWNNRLVPNRKRMASRLYIVTLLI